MFPSLRRSRRRYVAGVSSGIVLASLLVTAPMTASHGEAHDSVVDAVPANGTPSVLNGSVRAVEKVGDTVILGGNFTRARSPGGAEVTRNYLLSFDADNGQIRTSFVPALNGSVEDIAPGPDPGTVYVAGRFSSVNGSSTSKVVLLDLTDGSRVSSFDAPALNGRVESIERSGNRLFVGGAFRHAGGDFYGGLVAVNASTGARLPYLHLPVTDRHNDSGSGAQGAVGVRGLDVTPDGSRMVIIGNFKHVDDQDRDQAAVIDLGAQGATLSSWRTRRYEPYCFNWSYDTYMRGLSISPDGSYFVISTTGGHNAGTLCDTAARFEMDASGDGIEPTWVSDTGGDSLWAVETTGEAVYVGGHQRWMNNALGSDHAAPGAVPRPGIAAIDPDTGVPLKWNPGRNPRGAFVYDILATSDGLWIGSNTPWIGNRDYFRPRVAFFPLAGGAPVADDGKPELPGDVYLGEPAGGQAGLQTIEFDGTTAGTPTAADDGGVAWDRVRGAFRAGGALYYGRDDGALYKRALNDGEFGPESKLDPYNDPKWAGVATGSGNTYDGEVSAFYSQIPSVTGMYYDDGRLFYTLNGRSTLYYRYFSVDSGIVGVDQFEASTGRNWSGTEGMFAANGKVYVATANNGSLTAIDIEGGIPSGSVTVVDDTNDWRSGAMFLGGDPAVQNESPNAAFSADCAGLACDFDASGSSDDATIASYAWDFGDGATGSGKNGQHTYANEGTYDVTLTVTDDSGASDTATHEVNASEATDSDLAFRGVTADDLDRQRPWADVPESVQAGDTLVVIASFGDADPSPQAPPGWDQVATETAASSLVSTVWTKTADASDAGTRYRWDVAGSPKSTFTTVAYAGADDANPIRAIESTTERHTANHTSPTATASEGDWVLSYWADRTGGTTAWTPPSGVGVRADAYGNGGGRVTSLLADSDGPVSAGTVGGLTATTDVSSSRALSWTIVLRPAGDE